MWKPHYFNAICNEITHRVYPQPMRLEESTKAHDAHFVPDSHKTVSGYCKATQHNGLGLGYLGNRVLGHSLFRSFIRLLRTAVAPVLMGL